MTDTTAYLINGQKLEIRLSNMTDNLTTVH